MSSLIHMARFCGFPSPTPSPQVSSINGLKVTIPSEDMAQGSTYVFMLGMDTTLGSSARAEVAVYKSSHRLLNSKVRAVKANPFLCIVGAQVHLATTLTDLMSVVWGNDMLPYPAQYS